MAHLHPHVFIVKCALVDCTERDCGYWCLDVRGQYIVMNSEKLYADVEDDKADELLPEPLLRGSF